MRLHWKTVVVGLAIHQAIKNRNEHGLMVNPVVSAINAIGDSKTPMNVNIFSRTVKSFAKEFECEDHLSRHVGGEMTSRSYSNKSMILAFAAHYCKSFQIDAMTHGVAKIIEESVSVVSAIESNEFNRYESAFLPNKFKKLIEVISK